MRLNRTHKRPLEYSIGRADRDPMFKPVWYDGGAVTTLPSMVAGREEVSPQWDLAPLPFDLQQNDHVMRYWMWRLDRMERKS